MNGGGLDPLFAAAHLDNLLNGAAGGHNNSHSTAAAGQDASAQLSAFSQDELSWLEQQLSFAATPSSSTAAPQPFHTPGVPATLSSASGNASPASGSNIPLQPHAFPPVSQARFHPYQLPAERAQRMLRPPGPHAQLNLLSSAAQLQQLALQQQQQQRQHQQPQQQRQTATSNGLTMPDFRPVSSHGTNSTGVDGIDWASFGSFDSMPSTPFSVPSTTPYASYPQQLQHQQQLAHSFAASPRQPTVPRPQPRRQASTASAASSTTTPAAANHAHVLYPPVNSPPTVLLPDPPTPPFPPAPHASPATPRTNYSASSPAPPSALANEVTMRSASSESEGIGRTISGVTKRKRARSAPPPPLRSSLVGRTDDEQAVSETRSDQLDELFSWLDEQRWSFSNLFTALSEVSSPSDSDVAPKRVDPSLALTHRRRMEDFLSLDEPVFSSAGIAPHPNAVTDKGTDLGLRLLREARRRWSERTGGHATGPVEKGPNEVVRIWEELGALGRGEGSMAHAVRELHSHVHEGAVAGSVIRNITNRYGEAYAEANSDIKRLDDALSRPLDPNVTSAPREASVWTGTLVIPTLQADVLQAWLSDPAHAAQRKEGQSKKIDPEHMRIYSSLSPLDFHARGAELCRVILLRDAECMQRFGHVFDRLQTFTLGPVIALVDTCGFASYDEQSLWHHAVQTYLQLCVRYPELTEGKEATITIFPDLPPPVHPTALETLLIDRALHSHWDALRLFLLDSHGGLLRSAVRSFSGVRLTKFDLLSVCDDTMAVIKALGKSRTSRNDRILPYDPSISQIRNAWRQQALWDPTADLVVWSAATTHFLELSALYPQFGRGVRELPGLESILDSATSGSGSTVTSPPKSHGKANGITGR
ncbi:hypothetical protein JCM10908_001455 [Rhodotorula pacifica]|uniref:uncharacterized protein n=1 Tax=Rhodotorula pacifica TaxID=1495444 RepID=UPI00317DBBF2